MTAQRSRLAVPLLAAAIFAGGAVGGGVTAAILHEPPAVAATIDPCDDPTPTPTPNPVAQWVSPILARTELATDVQVTGSVQNPQVIMTTQPTEFDGGPVRIELSANYVNMITDPASNANGIGFDLFIDGVKVERLGLWGSHSQISMFGPLSISTVLADARAIPAGTHTIGIGVFKWAPGGDGYLKAAQTTARTAPVQLVVSRA